MATRKRFKSGLGFCLLLVSLLVSSQAVSQSKVEFLPGFNGPLPFSLETGYIGVDEGDEVQLFYYFIESENNPKEDPLLLWLTGGPGCSAISALFYEIGPIRFEEVSYNGSIPRLELKEDSWTKIASIIFVDLPVGTGFSYSKTLQSSFTGDFKASQNANEFLRKWLIDHPKFQSNALYIGGDSYSGITLPLYFNVMLQGNDNLMEPFLNLKGYILGNPVTDFTFDKNFAIPFAHGMAIISDELYKALQKTCNGKYYEEDPSNVECKQNLENYLKAKSGIDTAHILHPLCGFTSPRGHQLLEEKTSIFEERDEILRLKGVGRFNCRVKAYALAKYWADSESVQNALHVRKGSIREWIRCNLALNYSFDIESSIIYHAKLSEKGYRSLIYSGDHDMIAPFLGTQAWIRSLNYSIVDDWRQWLVDGQVSGYTRTYSNKMTFATVKGAGHVATDTKPKECTAMFKRWLLEEPL